MPSALNQEIDELKTQIADFEAAIAALEKPGTSPTGNSLVDILQARFSKLDSDAEREKSLKTARTLLQEVKAKLEGKERHLKHQLSILSARTSKMSEAGRQINALTAELQALLASLETDEKDVSGIWRELMGDFSMIDKRISVVLPKVVELTGQGSRFAIEALQSEQD